MTMYFSAATSPGQPEKRNEDYVAATSDLLVVLDGATVRTDTGCHHGVAWYARKLGGAILGAAAHHSVALPDVLATAIEQVAQLHPECDLTHPGTPSAAVAIVRSEDSFIRYLVLGDVSVVLDLGQVSGPTVVSDRRVSETAKAERARADLWPIGSEGKAVELLAMKQAELAARNRAGGYWIAAADPSVVGHAITGAHPKREVQRLAVATDGAARLIDLFHRQTWAAALDLLQYGGPQEMINRVRDIEDQDPRGEDAPRNKASDDATVAFAITGQELRSRRRSIFLDDPSRDVIAIAMSGQLFGANPTVTGEVI